MQSELTPEQTARCAALAKRYAALRPGWAQPGWACRDPETQRQFRLGPQEWADEDGLYCSDGRWGADSNDFGDAELLRAIVAGPDFTCDCTMGAMSLGLGSYGMTIGHTSYGYSVAHDCGWDRWVLGTLHATRPEAILAACVAAAEAAASAKEK